MSYGEFFVGRVVLGRVVLGRVVLFPVCFEITPKLGKYLGVTWFCNGENFPLTDTTMKKQKTGS